MIIVITGPTAVGKTKLSIELAKQLNGEIINADAMQVYKYLNIGTAKVTEEEKENIPHHLFDIVNPLDNFTAYDYQSKAREVIDSLLSQNKIPILVGGTGLYIKSALYDYQFAKENTSNTYDDLTNEEILNKINTYNIDINFDINNRRRLVRVLNKLENNTYSVQEESKPIYKDIIFIGLTTDRQTLYNKINERVVKMFTEGLIDEVKPFFDKHIYSKALMTGIGYKEVYSYLNNEISKEECISLIQKNTRHYAKRQFTFFNHQLPIKWFTTDYNDFNNTINQVLEYIKTTSNR